MTSHQNVVLLKVDFGLLQLHDCVNVLRQVQRCFRVRQHFLVTKKKHNNSLTVFHRTREAKDQVFPMISSVTEKRDDEKLRKIYFISLPAETCTNFSFLPFNAAVWAGN